MDERQEVINWLRSLLGAEASDQEIINAARTMQALGLRPDRHECAIWFQRGHVHVEIAYTLLVKYAKAHGYINPRFRRLTPAEIKEDGMPPGSIGYECKMIQQDLLPMWISLANKTDAKTADDVLCVTGRGYATPEEWRSTYFPPKGRSRAWRVQKRALADAIRRTIGSPGREEIEALRTPELPALTAEETADAIDALWGPETNALPNVPNGGNNHDA